MVAASILPVAIHGGELYFLFGKENPMEDSAKGFSDFGGRVEPGETIYQAALREGSEETTGFLGNSKQLKAHIKKMGGPFVLTHNKYHVHIFWMDYDAKLPTYYNNNHQFLWSKMDHQILAETKLFEKIEMEWFRLDDMRSRRSEFREFYREILDLFIEKQAEIRAFLETHNNKKRRNRRTRKTLSV